MKKLLAIFTALVLTAGMAIGQGFGNNSATTEQHGQENEADVKQYGQENVVGDIYQHGNENDAKVQQGEFGGNSVQSNFAEASIKQIGNKNVGVVMQRQGWPGGTALSVHTIEQTGHRNNGSLTTFNGGNSGSIVQEGNDNFASGRQSNNPDNLISIKQIGNFNVSTVEQLNNKESVATVKQEGHRNFSDVDQIGNNNLFEEKTVGNDNRVIADQQNAHNRLTLNITGNSNRVDATQDENTLSYIDIEGDRNQFDLAQIGYENQMGANIIGHGNTIDVVQNGGGNKIMKDRNNAGAWRKDGIDILGNNNTVDIDQLVPGGNRANVIINGLSNQTAIVQQ